MKKQLLSVSAAALMLAGLTASQAEASKFEAPTKEIVGPLDGQKGVVLCNLTPVLNTDDVAATRLKVQALVNDANAKALTFKISLSIRHLF